MHLQGITLQRALELQQAFANDATHEVAAVYALACAAWVMQYDGSAVLDTLVPVEEMQVREYFK